jgi:hypothetical protein
MYSGEHAASERVAALYPRCIANQRWRRGAIGRTFSMAPLREVRRAFLLPQGISRAAEVVERWGEA